MKLSVGLITYNEEKDLPRTLDAIKDIADEIIIVDNGSTDNTIEIAKTFNATVYQEEWKGFGEQKNSVIDKCKGEWILLIDADEEVSPELKEQIVSVINNPNDAKVYKVKFNSICFGKKIKHGGWGNFYRIRLFLNGIGRYNTNQVHEKFITDAASFNLNGYINHYTYNTLEDYLVKFNKYTSQSAEDYFKAGRKRGVISSYFSSALYFFKSYILQGGFLDGYEGYLLARLGAMAVLVKYAKLRGLNKQ